jgi:hypothetical protein
MEPPAAPPPPAARRRFRHRPPAAAPASPETSLGALLARCPQLLSADGRLNAAARGVTHVGVLPAGAAARVRVLLLGGNPLVHLVGAEALTGLHTLSLAGSGLNSFDALVPLAACARLRVLLLEGTPLSRRACYRQRAVALFAAAGCQLAVLDCADVSPDEAAAAVPAMVAHARSLAQLVAAEARIMQLADLNRRLAVHAELLGATLSRAARLSVALARSLPLGDEAVPVDVSRALGAVDYYADALPPPAQARLLSGVERKAEGLYHARPSNGSSSGVSSGTAASQQPPPPPVGVTPPPPAAQAAAWRQAFGELAGIQARVLHELQWAAERAAAELSLQRAVVATADVHSRLVAEAHQDAQRRAVELRLQDARVSAGLARSLGQLRAAGGVGAHLLPLPPTRMDVSPPPSPMRARRPSATTDDDEPLARRRLPPAHSQSQRVPAVSPMQPPHAPQHRGGGVNVSSGSGGAGMRLSPPRPPTTAAAAPAAAASTWRLPSATPLKDSGDEHSFGGSGGQGSRRRPSVPSLRPLASSSSSLLGHAHASAPPTNSARSSGSTRHAPAVRQLTAAAGAHTSGGASGGGLGGDSSRDSRLRRYADVFLAYGALGGGGDDDGEAGDNGLELSDVDDDDDDADDGGGDGHFHADGRGDGSSRRSTVSAAYSVTSSEVAEAARRSGLVLRRLVRGWRPRAVPTGAAEGSNVSATATGTAPVAGDVGGTESGGGDAPAPLSSAAAPTRPVAPVRPMRTAAASSGGKSVQQQLLQSAGAEDDEVSAPAPATPVTAAAASSPADRTPHWRLHASPLKITAAEY